jgi:hypothetical protein
MEVCTMYRVNKYSILTPTEQIKDKLSRNMFRPASRFDVNESKARELSALLKDYVNRAGRKERF